MARAKEPRNGRLEGLEQAPREMAEAQATLIQNQAAFLARTAETDREMAELKRETNARFARIEAILLDHSRILEALPNRIRSLEEAVRDEDGLQAARTKWDQSMRW